MRILRELGGLDEFGPKFFRDDLETFLYGGTYDFSKYRHQVNATILKKTKLWGWNQRKGSDDDRTEFFFFYRHVTQIRARAVFREHLIKQTNKLFQRLFIACHIECSGLLNSNEIEAIREDLCAGNISFEETHKALENN